MAQNQIISGLEKMEPHLIFQGLSAQNGPLQTVAPIMLAIAGLILIWGHVGDQAAARRQNRKQEDVWIKTIFVFGFMVTAGYWVTGAAKAGDAIAQSTGVGDPLTVASRCLVVATSFPELSDFTELRLQNDPNKPPGYTKPGEWVNAAVDGTWWGNVKGFFAGMGEVAVRGLSDGKGVIEGAVNLVLLAGTFLTIFMKYIVLIPAMLLLMIALLLAAAICWFIEALRYFFLVCGAVLLPIAIAAMRTRALERQGMNYITNMVAVACWPIGWALGHMGTVGLFNAWVSTMSGTAIMGKWANAMTWENILTQGITFKSAGTAVATGAQMAAAFGSFPLYMLVSFCLGGVGVCVWVFTVTVGAPVLVTKLVTAGAAFYSAATGQAADTAGKAVQSAGQAAQSIAMAGGSIAGFSGAPLAAAGGAIAGAGGGISGLAQGSLGGLSGAMSGGAGGYQQFKAQETERAERNAAQESAKALGDISRSLRGFLGKGGRN